MQADEAKPDISRPAAWLLLVVFVAVMALVVSVNSKWNAFLDDTLLLKSFFEMLERFSSFWSNANSNPLQALFDVFPSGHRLDAIPNVIAHALFGPGMHIDFFYMFCAALLAVATAAMARSIGLPRGLAVLAGMLVPLLIMPIYGAIPLAEDYYVLWPILYYSAAGTVFVTALLWSIDGRSTWRTVLITIVMILVLVHLSTIQIFHMTELAPAMLTTGIAALFAAHDGRELIVRIICAAAVVVALAAAGIFHYLYAVGIDNAQHVFYRELPVFMSFGPPNWKTVFADLGEVFYSPFSPSYSIRSNLAGAVVVPLSQLGAVYLALFGQTKPIRVFGRAMVAWVIVTAGIIIFLHNFFYYTGQIYLGPDPRHFLEILWPYYAICLAALLFAGAEGGLGLLWRAGLTSSNRRKGVPYALPLALLAAPTLMIAGRTFLHWTPHGRQGDLRPFIHFDHRTPIVDFLEPRIAIALDQPFRGSAIFVPTVFDKDVKPYGVWRRTTVYNYGQHFFGNDLIGEGLRQFNIPTLDEVTHNITPPFYLTVRELLSRPGIDVFERHYGGVVTRLSEPVLRLLGARYVISDYQLPLGTERFAMPIPEKIRATLEGEKVLRSPVRISELHDPNVGNYSPTDVVRAKTARDIILRMAQSDFDGRRTVVADDLSLPDNLMPATDPAMIVRMGGLALSASSPGASVLVLPVQYSHCWRVVSGDATLFRADLMLLGVRFTGKLEVELRQFFGPFWQSACRVEDARDVERLDMLGAAGTIAPADKDFQR